VRHRLGKLCKRVQGDGGADARITEAALLCAGMRVVPAVQTLIGNVAGLTQCRKCNPEWCQLDRNVEVEGSTARASRVECPPQEDGVAAIYFFAV
jgi:hypothetical protein